MVLYEIEDRDASDGDAVVNAPPKMSYYDSRRVLENGFLSEYPHAAITSRYANRFLEASVIGIGEGDFRIWGSAQSGYSIPFEQAWQNLHYTDLLTLLYEDGLNGKSYGNAQAFIDDVEDLMTRYDDHLDINKIRPDGIITFLSIRQDDDYLDYATLGLDKTPIGPLNPGFNINSTNETITLPSGTWAGYNVEIGDVLFLYNTEQVADNLKRMQVYDISGAVAYVADGNNNTVTNADDTTLVITPQSRSAVPNVVREYYRTIYEANNAGKSRLLTSTTRANITANEQSFSSSAYNGKTYMTMYDNGRHSSDDTIDAANGGFLVYPDNTSYLPNGSTPVFGWGTNRPSDFGKGCLNHLPDPKLIAEQVASTYPSEYFLYRNSCEYYTPLVHKLVVKSTGAGGPTGNIQIGFPYYSTYRDDDTGFAFNNTSKTITRNDGGSWITEGYEAGKHVRVNGGSTGNGATDPKLIASLTASVLTLDAGETLTTASGDKTVTFNAMELSGNIDISNPVRAQVGISNVRDAVNGFDVTSTTTITRSDGGTFLADGFESGDTLVITNSAGGVNDGSYTLSGATASTLTTTGLTNVSDDTTMQLSVAKQAQLRDTIKTALDAMDNVPPCMVLYWWDGGQVASTTKSLLLLFFDQNKHRETWPYNPPSPGFVAGPDTGTGFTLTNNSFPTKDTIVRNDGGSWVDDGFAAGGGIRILNATNSANNGCYLIHAVTANTITLKNRNTNIIYSGIASHFPTSLTTTANDTTVTFMHTGYGVPIYGTAELSSHVLGKLESDSYYGLYIDASAAGNISDAYISVEQGDHQYDFPTSNATAESIPCINFDVDFLDEDLNVIELYGKTIPSIKDYNIGSWYEDHFTAWFNEYKDLGGRGPDYLFFDHEPSTPNMVGPYNIGASVPSVLYGGSASSPTVQGWQAIYNTYKYWAGKDDWDDQFTMIRPDIKAAYTFADGNFSASSGLHVGDFLYQNHNGRLQISESKAHNRQRHLHGFVNAVRSVFPDIYKEAFAAHTAQASTGTPFDSAGAASAITYHNTFGSVLDGNMESFFSASNSQAMAQWDQLPFLHNFISGDELNYTINPIVVIEDIARNSSMVCTVNCSDRTAIRADARKGNFQCFNNYFIGQYIKIKSGSSTGMTDFIDGTDSGYTQNYIYKPILSVATADGDGLVTQITYQDHYITDATNGFDLGQSVASRIDRLDGGSFLVDGWKSGGGEAIIVSNATNAAHNGTYTTSSVTASRITLTTSPFSSVQNADTSVRIAKGAKTTVTPTVNDSWAYANVDSTNNWHKLLWVRNFFCGTSQVNTYPTCALFNTYDLNHKARYVAYGGLLGSLEDDRTVDYVAEIIFHKKMYDGHSLTYTDDSASEEQIVAAEEDYNAALEHLYEVCPYWKVKPLSINSKRGNPKSSEYLISGCIMPNNRRLFRVTVKTDYPQDMTCPGAAAQSTHTPGPLGQKNGYVLFQDRFGNQFKVPGNLVSTDSFNTVGWWTIS